MEDEVLDGVSTQTFSLNTLVASNEKSGLPMVKFGGEKSACLIDNYVVSAAKASTIDPSSSTAVDPNTLTKTTRLVSLSSARSLGRPTKPLETINNETIHVVDSGCQGDVPVTVIHDAMAGGSSLIGTLPASSLGGAGDGTLPIQVPANSVQSDVIGSVPGSIGTECLRIVPQSLSGDMTAVLPCTSTQTVTLSRVANRSIAGLHHVQDALQNADHTAIGQNAASSLASTDGISMLNPQEVGTTALQNLERVVVTSTPGSNAGTIGTLTLTDTGQVAAGSNASTIGTLTLTDTGQVTAGSNAATIGTLTLTDAGQVGVTETLVNISVPNVELTTSGQLLISQGSLVYAQQGNNLVAVPSHMVDGQLTAGTSTEQPAAEPVEPKKKGKGGWPKGKKRKVDPLKEANAPKKPTSAYTLFLNEQRPELKKKNKDMHFSEVTKVLGNQWSSMSQEHKQKYFTAAENDKKRYIEELKAYQQTETYQALIKRLLAKKLKNIVGSHADHATIDSDVSNSMLSELQLDDDDPSDLFCRTCDQYFSSVHNKKEHIYGKQHLVTLSLKLCEIEKETEQIEQQALGIATEPMLSTPILPSNQTDLPTTDNNIKSQESRVASEPVNIEQFEEDFVDLNYEREQEIRELHKYQQESLDFNLQLRKQLKDLQDGAEKLEGDLKNLKAIGSSLQAQLDGLRMVPTLFGVINF